jgi:hypothetical protein
MNRFICLVKLVFLARAIQIQIRPNVVYPLPLNSTDQFLMAVQRDSLGLLTIVNDIPMDRYNQTSFINLQIDTTRLYIQPGHNYIPLGNSSSVLSLVLNANDTNSNIFEYKMFFILTIQPGSGSSQAMLPLFLGNAFLLRIDQTYTNIVFDIYVNPESENNCFAMFEHLYLDKPALIPAINKLSRGAGSALYNTNPFIKNNKNFFEFLQNSIIVETRVEVKDLTFGQDLLFHSYCYNQNSEGSFKADFSQAISSSKGYFITIDNWINNGKFDFKIQEKVFNSMTVEYFFAIMKIEGDYIASTNSHQDPLILSNYSREFYKPYFFAENDSSLISTTDNPVMSNKIYFDRKNNYILNLRAIVRPSSLKMLPLYKQTVLNLMTIDLGYRTLSLASDNVDTTKLGWLFTAILVSISAVVFWCIFIYLVYLHKFIAKQEIRRSSYKGFLKEGEGIDSLKEPASFHNRHFPGLGDPDSLTTNILGQNINYSNSNIPRFESFHIQNDKILPMGNFDQDFATGNDSNGSFDMRPPNLNLEVLTHKKDNRKAQDMYVGSFDDLDSDKRNINSGMAKVSHNYTKQISFGQEGIPAKIGVPLSKERFDSNEGAGSESNINSDKIIQKMSLQNLNKPGLSMAGSYEFKTPNFHNSHNLSGESEYIADHTDNPFSNHGHNLQSDKNQITPKDGLFKFGEYQEEGPYQQKNPKYQESVIPEEEVSDNQSIQHTLDNNETHLEANNDRLITSDKTAIIEDIEENQTDQTEPYDAFRETNEDQSVVNNKYRTDYNDELISINENIDKSFGQY